MASFLLLFSFVLAAPAASADLDESTLTALGDEVRIDVGSYGYDRRRRQFSGRLRISNLGAAAVDAPVYLLLDSAVPTSVRLLNADGVTASGKPYYDFTALLPAGVLAPGAASAIKTLAIAAPSGASFALNFVALVEAGAGNSAPQFTSNPPTTARTGALYSYAASANDADADALTFALVQAPPGMTIDAGSGRVEWTPQPGVTSPQAVTLEVTDPAGASVTQSFQIVIENTPPMFTSTPPASAPVGAAFAYPATASDVDGDVLTFSLGAGNPAGVAIDPETGLLTWTPAGDDVGVRTLVLQVSDGRGGSDQQTFDLAITDAPPQVTLSAPASVQADGAFTVSAEAVDDLGVTEVVFYVDGLEVARRSGPPFSVELTAPGAAGLSVIVRVVAIDGTGNAAEDSRNVPVVASPDIQAPVIAALQLPSQAAPGEVVLLGADVSDDRGVEAVDFDLDGQPAGSDATAPYQVSAALDAALVPGETVAVVVTARDAAGNAAAVTGSIEVVAAADTVAPRNVTLDAPAQAPPGATVPLSAGAVDDTGVFRVEFLADGVVIGEDRLAPYGFSHVLPAGLGAGAQVGYLVRAYDFAGNSAQSAVHVLDVVDAQQGFVVGEVFDDSTGLAIAGARIDVLIAGGEAITMSRVFADANGRFSLSLPQGPARLRIAHDGYTRAWRDVDVLPAVATAMFDARLTPRSPGAEVRPLAGASLDAGMARVEVPVGVFADEVEIALTELSGQGLPTPLPLGWGPILAFELAPDDLAGNRVLQIDVPGLAPDGLVVAQFEPADNAWRAIEAVGTGGGTRIEIARLGTVVFARADDTPQAPPSPAPGALLSGVTSVAIPAAAAASVLPAPDVLFMQPGARSEVSLELEDVPALPSGTPVEVRFSEDYALTSGAHRLPPDRRQDLLVYRRTGGSVADFIASPSLLFDPALLREGVIRLDAMDGGDGAGIALLGPSPGTVASADGQRLTLPASALGRAAPVTIDALDPAGSGLDAAAFDVLAGAAFDFDGERLASSATWSLTPDPLPSPDDRLLVVRARDVDGITRFELVAIAAVAGGEVSAGAGGLGLPLPGIRESGRYWLVRIDGDIGWLTGTLDDAGGGALGEVVVAHDTLALVSVADADDPSYVLAAPLGAVTLQASALQRGASASAVAAIADVDAIEVIDLTLVPSAPGVLSTTPADGSDGASTVQPIRVTFSRAMNAATLDASTLTLSAGGVPVAAAVTLLADGVTALLSPASPLASETLHAITVAADVEDRFGNGLAGNRPDGSFRAEFTTEDTTPPPAPPAGQVTATLPDDDGTVAITGTQGTVEPGALVSARNDSTGSITSVVAGADGSFAVRVDAGTADTLALVLRDLAGNERVISPGPMTDGMGTAVVGSGGGVLTLPDGSEFTFQEGAFARPAVVSIERLERAAIPAPDASAPEFGLTLAAGLRIDTGGEELLRPLQMRVPVSGDYTNGDQFLLTLVREVDGEKYYDAQETATYQDGFAVINSPPWAGVAGILLDVVAMWAMSSSQISFVTGKVRESPLIGTLAMSHDVEVDNGGTTVFDVVASVSMPEFGSVVSLELVDKDGNVVDSYSAGAGAGEAQVRILHTVTANPSTSQQVLSAVGDMLSQPAQVLTLSARAVLETSDGRRIPYQTQAGGTLPGDEVKVTGAVKIVPFGSAKTGRATTSYSIHDRFNALSSPAVGAFVEIGNGLGRAYPSITTTSRTGGFVLAAKPGAGFFRVFDPLTGNGKAFPINVPDTPFDFTDVGTVYVPVSLGDTLPPTLDIQVSGTLLAGEELTVTLNATDDKGVEVLDAQMLGEDQFLGAPPSGTAASQTFTYTPLFSGQYRIDGRAVDTSGNEVRRSTVVTVSEPAGSDPGSAQGQGSSLADGAENVDPNVTVYIDLATEVSPGVALADFQVLDVYFEDVNTGARIAAIGGTDSSGERMIIRPAAPLPFGAEMELEGLGDTISFKTRGLSGLEVVPGFQEIRGVAGNRTHAYVADYGDAANGLKVVAYGDASGGSGAAIIGSYSLTGRARGVAVDGNLLAVVGGGQDELPFLRVYDIHNPAQPQRLGTAILFPVKGQAIPVNVRLSGSFAYVATVGAGVQVVDLQELIRIMQIPFAERVQGNNPLEVNGQSSIVGGFRLPDPAASPPLIGSAFDIGLGLSASLTGGSQSRLYVLGQPTALVGDNEVSAVFAGFNLIEQSAGVPYLDLGKPIQRFAMAADFVIASDENGDGVPDYRNITLGAVSHGPSGISLVDVTRPDQVAVVGSIDDLGTVHDMAFVDRYLFTGARMITFDDPAQPIVGGALAATDENGNSTALSNGRDVALADLRALPGNRREATLLSANANANALQVARIVMTSDGRQWDIIRTIAYEPIIHPDNAKYLDTGDPVNPYTGELVFTETDAAAPGRGVHFEFKRTYRSAIEFDGLLGHGWDHNYNDRLRIEPLTGNVIRYDGSGRADRFTRSGNTYSSPRGLLATLEPSLQGCAVNATLQLVFADGMRRHFEPSAQEPAGRLRLECIEDRFGNAMSMRYDGADRLVEVTDSLSRGYRFVYGTDGRLRTLRDFAGRAWHYRYDFDGNLMSVRTPAADGFPQGQVTRFVYSGGFTVVEPDGDLSPTRLLNHNLLRVIDANGNEYLRNSWYPVTDPDDIRFDRVMSQRLGDPAGTTGGTYQFVYNEDPQSPGRVRSAITINRSGDSTFREYNETGELERVTEIGVTLGDTVADLVTRYTYFDSGLIRSVETPLGVRSEYQWSDGAARAERRGDLRELTLHPHDGGQPRTWKYTPGPFGIAARRIDPEGNTTDFTVTAAGLVTRIDHPAVALPDGTLQLASEHYTYGTHGEKLSYTNEVGDVIRYSYHDGCISGIVIPDSCGEPVNVPGYLASITVDAALGSTPQLDAARPVAAVTRLKYDLAGNIVEIEDPRGLVTTQAFDALNQRVSMSDPRRTVTFGYDGNGGILRETHDLDDLETLTVERSYDALGLLRSESEKAGPDTFTSEFFYDASENLVRILRPSGAAFEIDYDERARPVAWRVPDDNAQDLYRLAIEYDADGNVVRSVDGAGNVLTWRYNGFNEERESEDGNGNRVRRTLDDRGLPVTVTWLDALERVTRRLTNDRDRRGRIVRLIEEVFVGGAPVDSIETAMFLDASGRIERLVDALGNVSTYRYDGLDRLLETVDPAGNALRWVYDGIDLAERRERDGSGSGVADRVTGVEADVFGRVTRSTVAPGTVDERVVEYTWDARDNPVSRQDGSELDTRYEYDPHGRRTRVRVGSDVIGFEYDDDGRVVRRVDAFGNGVDIEYDARDRVTLLRHDDGSTETFTYRADDRPVMRIDRAGNRFDYSYDAAGRRTAIAVTALPGFGGGISRLEFAYDPLDHLNRGDAISAAGNHEFTVLRDSRSAVREQVQDGVTVLSVPDRMSSRVRTVYPGGFDLLTLRDAATRPAELMSASGDLLASFEYLGSALQRQGLYGNGTAAGRQFNAAWEEVGRAYADPVSAIATAMNLRRDTAGRVIGQAFAHLDGAGDTYQYSAEGWLERERRGVADPLAANAATLAAVLDVSYAYDAAGNRASSAVVGGAAVDYESNGLNQYTTVDGAPLDHDANGNLAADGSRTFEYDAFGNLLRVREAASGMVLAEYGYDALLRRTTYRTPSVFERYIHDGDDVIAVLDELGNTIREYVHADLIDRPVMMRTAAGEFWYQYDHRGAVVALTDASGSVVERYAYDAFGSPQVQAPDGTPLPASAFGNPLRLAARHHDDATGLVHMRARDYDPKLGRFLQPDPAGHIDGMHLYAFAGNDPINFSDPTGLYRRAVAERIRNRGMAGISLKTAWELSKLVFGAGAAAPGRGLLTGATKNLLSFNKIMSSKTMQQFFAEEFMKFGIGQAKGAYVKGVKDYLKRTNPKADPNKLDFLVDSAMGVADAFAETTSATVKEIQKRDMDRHRFRSDEQFKEDMDAVAKREDEHRRAGRLPPRGGRASTPSGRRSGCCCFDAGTPVVTRDGMRAIEDLRIGDLVLSEDPTTGDVGYNPVTELFLTPGKQLFHLVLARADGTRETLTSTDNHPFYVEGTGWVDSADLEPGMQVRSAGDAALAVISVTPLERSSDTYNISVANFQSFYAGQGRALVHNCDACRAARDWVSRKWRDLTESNVERLEREGREKNKAFNDRTGLSQNPNTVAEHVPPSRGDNYDRRPGGARRRH